MVLPDRRRFRILAVVDDFSRESLVLGEKEEFLKQLRDTNRQIESLLDRVVDANSASVVSAYEARIDKLERQKIVLNERLDKSVPPKRRLEDCI